MAVAVPQLDEAIDSLSAVASTGAPGVGAAAGAVALFDQVEQARRLAAVAAVDAMAHIESARAFYEHGHANARVMFAHIAGVSGSEAHRLDKIRRMIGDADLIHGEWRRGRLSVDKAALLGQAFANPRTRDRFLIDQRWFIKKARRFGYVRLKKIIARWIEVHDTDGPEPGPDPSFERRNARLSQDHFSKAWLLEASLGSMQGSLFNETLRAYLQAEFQHDWKVAEAIHGVDTCAELLARTHEQRMADALCQIAADAVNSDKPSAPVKRVHNIVWTAEAYEELLCRWVNAPARLLDPDRYNITDLDGRRQRHDRYGSHYSSLHRPRPTRRATRRHRVLLARLSRTHKQMRNGSPQTRSSRRAFKPSEWPPRLQTAQPVQRTRLHRHPLRQRRHHHHFSCRPNHPIIRHDGRFGAPVHLFAVVQQVGERNLGAADMHLGAMLEHVGHVCIQSHRRRVVRWNHIGSVARTQVGDERLPALDLHRRMGA